TLVPEVLRIRQAFARSGQSMRNVGAFCAVLCRDVPGIAESVGAQQLLDRLRLTGKAFAPFWVTYQQEDWRGELPPLPPAYFEEKVLSAAADYTEAGLEDWFRHGRGPVKQAGQTLGRGLKPPEPRSLAGALAALLERPRLAGIRSLVAPLVSALTLPPRRLAWQEIPVGGYADVTTHGRPDQILPSQFALDGWDFFRRFAEHE